MSFSIMCQSVITLRLIELLVDFSGLDGVVTKRGRERSEFPLFTREKALDYGCARPGVSPTLQCSANLSKGMGGAVEVR